MKTVGELKKFLETLNDDMPIITNSSNFELRGAIVDGVNLTVNKYIKETETFTDGFDYTQYNKDVYHRNDDGTECLYIW